MLVWAWEEPAEGDVVMGDADVSVVASRVG